MPKLSDVIDFLDEKEALKTGDSPWGHNEVNDNYDIYHVDWKQLFKQDDANDDSSINGRNDTVWSIDENLEVLLRILKPLCPRTKYSPLILIN